MSARHLHLYLSGQHAGELHTAPHGGLTLHYDPTWTQHRMAYPLSLSLPLDAVTHKPQKVGNVITGLLPESRGTLEDWRHRYRIADIDDPVQVLQAVGMDVAGAAQFTAEREDVTARGGGLVPLSEDDVAEMIREARVNAGAMPLLEEVPRISLAGQQAKFALAWEGGRWNIPRGNAPSTHIFKPAPEVLTDVDLNEMVMMTAAASIGLRTARSEVHTFGQERVFVSERYDRVRTEEGVARIHQEDMVQAFGLPVEAKYQTGGGTLTLPAIIKLLQQHVPDEDIDEVVRLTAFNVAIGNADAHGKNHAVLIYPGGRVVLAPAYDLVSTAAYPGYNQNLAFAIGRERSYTRVISSDWQRFARACALEPDRVLARVVEVWDKTPDAVSEALGAAQAPALLRDRVGAVLSTLPSRTAGVDEALGARPS